MTNEILGERRRALEEAFFAKHNEALRQRLRAADEATSRKAALAASSGITDEAVLDELVALDLTPDTLAALWLVPLVLVAWADGTLERPERNAILDAAREAGLDREPAIRQLLEQWLAQRPAATLETAWTDYIHAITGTMEPARQQALKSELVGRARRVAEAAGGFLGLVNRVSTDEAAVLHKLEQAFPH